jgi:hypothetical protein
VIVRYVTLCPVTGTNVVEGLIDHQMVFRTLVVAPAFEEAHVRERIDATLRTCDRWLVLRAGACPLAPGERQLAKT